MTIPTQKEWVEGCLAYYLENYYEPGNPEDGEWEESHYPLPKCLGGEETVLLLKRHHAVQGVLQSEELQHPSIYGWEKEFLEGELLSLFEKWTTEKGYLANRAKMENTTHEQRGAWLREQWAKLSSEEKSARCKAIRANQTPESKKAHAEKLRQATLALPPEWREQMKKIKTATHGKPVEVITPGGDKLVFPAVREASRQTGLHPYVLRRLLNNEGAKSQQGHTARFL
jgi:hypothetical protein